MKKEVKINSEGRIVIPADIRKIMNITDNDILTIEITDTGELKIEPKQKRCGICNATENLNQRGEIILCDNCLDAIEEKFFTN